MRQEPVNQVETGETRPKQGQGGLPSVWIRCKVVLLTKWWSTTDKGG